MAFRESLRDTATALRARPELFVLGGTIGLLQTGVLGLVDVSFSVLAPGTGVLAALASFAAVVLSLFVVLPLFVGLYELTLRPRPTEPSLAALRRAVTTALQRYPRVLVTDAVAGLAAALVGLLVALGWYVAATAGRYVRYVHGDPGAPQTLENVSLLVAAALLGAILGSFLVRFADVLAAFHDRDGVAAVAESAVAARRNPVALAGFAAVLVAVNLASLGALAGVESVVTTGPAGSVPGTAVVAVLALAILGAAITIGCVLHAAFSRRHLSPNDASTAATPSSLRECLDGRSPARVAIAVVLVVGLVSGTAAVRTLDPAVHSPPELAPLATDDPDEVVRTAAARTAAANHRQVLYSRNASDPEAEYQRFSRSGYDYADRQVYHYYFSTPDGEDHGGFFADGTMALLRPVERLDGLAAYERGPWQVQPAPIWDIADARATAEYEVVPGGDADGWRVVSANASTMVVRYDDPDTVDDALGSRSYGTMAEPMANESHVTAVVDRERGVLDEVRFHLHSLETGDNWQYRIEYREVGSVEVERPEPIRDRRLAERLWDAVYY